MQLEEPTEAQIKEFWEWCGFNWVSSYDCFTMPEGDEKALMFNGDIDLNNLFKYAVPKAVEELRVRPDVRHIHNAYAKLFNIWLERLFSMNYKDLAPALFWVIWEVKK